MKSDFLIALTQLVAERHLPREEVLQAVEAALVSAFKKDSTSMGQDISVKLNPNTGEMSVFALRTVVEQVEDPTREIDLKQARAFNASIALGEEIATPEQLPHQASRIAAQTAKQVVLQRLREAEREKTFQEFLSRTDDIVSGVLDQMEPGRIWVMELGRVEAVLPPEEQVPTERYRKGQRLKVYIVDVRRTPRGPEIIVSRTHKNLLKRLFEVEVPEVYNGVVEIKEIAREPGFRSKVAVASRQEGVDPVGSCIGMRGNRIQSIVNELQGEKIDIVRWDKDLKTFISNALSPSEVVQVEANPDDRTAVVVVPERHLSLAIGKEGQNARLAAKLSGWHLDIKSVSEWDEIRAQRRGEEEARRLALEEAEKAAAEAAAAEEVAVTVAEVEAAVAAAEEVVAAAQEAPVLVEGSEEEVLEPVAEVAQIPPEKVQEEEAELLKLLEQETEELAVEATIAPAEPQEPPAGVVGEPVEVVLDDLFDEVEFDEEDDEETEEAGDDSVWSSPIVNPDAGKIRFAEDFADEFRGRGRRGGRRRRGGAGSGSAANRGGRSAGAGQGRQA